MVLPLINVIVMIMCMIITGFNIQHSPNGWISFIGVLVNLLALREERN
jgi:hypothetical protein